MPTGTAHVDLGSPEDALAAVQCLSRKYILGRVVHLELSSHSASTLPGSLVGISAHQPDAPRIEPWIEARNEARRVLRELKAQRRIQANKV